MRHHMPRSSAGQLSFVEAEEALKMSPGRDSGHLSEAVCGENCCAVENMVMDNRRATVQQIADTVGINTGSIKMILHKHLLMTKVCARWVPQKCLTRK